MFILPLFIILGLISIGMETERIESWRTSKKNWMRLVMGCVLLGLGVMMVVK